MRLWIGSHRILAGLALAGGALVSAAQAVAQPFNDDAESALGLFFEVTEPGTLNDATNDGSSSADAIPGQPDVWYTYVASGEQTIQLDTCGTHDAGGLDTILSVHSGAPGTVENELVANDDWPTDTVWTACQGEDADPSRDSAVLLNMTQDQQIWIRVTRFSLDSHGDGNFLIFVPEPTIGTSLLPGLVLLAALRVRGQAGSKTERNASSGAASG